MRPWRVWTTGEEKELRRLAAEGKSYREMAAALGRSPGATKRKYIELGLPSKSLYTSADELRRMAEMIRQGKTCREVCSALGRSTRTVRANANKMGLRFERQVTTPKWTLCWNCAKACKRGCSWSDHLEPVKGWRAEKGTVSWIVIKCPEFQPEKKDWYNNCDLSAIRNGLKRGTEPKPR